MFSAEEIKCAVETLNQRLNWFRKALNENKVKPQDRSHYEAKAKVLETTIAKFDALAKASSPSDGLGEESYSAAPAKTEKVATSDLQILLVDDDECSREVLRALLEEIGVSKVEEANAGDQGLEKLKSEHAGFDAVLCDWNMPGMSGLDVLKSVRANDKYTKLPFIMVTGMGDVQNIQEAIQHGVSDYVVKPIDLSTLELKLNKIVGQVSH
jgi:two-component system chemotaxis response regulator CheY